MSSSCAFVLCAIAATPRSSPSHMSAVEGEGAAVAVLPYPFVALNTADLSAEQVERSIHIGLELGVSVVDFHLGSSANGVHERDGVARAVKSLGRSALTLITKLDKPPANLTDPSAAAALARQTLDDEFAALGIDSVDVLLLKDSATCAVMQAQWAVLEEQLAAGRAKALGTYNFCDFSTTCLLGKATVPPAYNFVMRHVGMGPDATGLLADDASHGIRTVCYGTLGEPVALSKLLTDPTLVAIAEAHAKSVEAVALQWNAQSGYAISSRITADYAPDNEPHGTSHCSDDCRAALSDMAALSTWSLTHSEMMRLSAVRLEGYPQSPTYYSSSGCEASFAVSNHPNRSSCNSSAPTHNSSWC